MVDQVRAKIRLYRTSAPPLQLFILHRAISHAPPQSTAFDILFYEGQEKTNQKFGTQTGTKNHGKKPGLFELFRGIVSFVFFPCLLRLIRFLFLVLLRLLVLVLRTGAPARVGGCRSVLEPGSWSTPLVVRSFVVYVFCHRVPGPWTSNSCG